VIEAPDLRPRVKNRNAPSRRIQLQSVDDAFGSSTPALFPYCKYDGVITFESLPVYVLGDLIRASEEPAAVIHSPRESPRPAIADSEHPWHAATIYLFTEALIVKYLKGRSKNVIATVKAESPRSSAVPNRNTWYPLSLRSRSASAIVA
jgi:hypothetical protein